MNNPIIIFGSSRSGGDTRKAIDELNSDGTIPIVELRNLDITPYDYDHKNQNDDYLPLMEKVVTHDQIILATPVYWYTMSATMKIFIDRLSDLLRLRQDLGRGLAQTEVYVLTSYSTTVPQGFEESFSQTCAYMDMIYNGCFYYHAGKDKNLLAGNKKISDFRKIIDLNQKWIPATTIK